MAQKISKITVDRNLCIGAASCVVLAGEVFELDNENKAVVKKYENVPNETILSAAQSCPTKAIFLFGDDEKQIYP